MKNLNREYKVEAVTWLPTGSAFACVEHSGHVHILVRIPPTRDLQDIIDRPLPQDLQGSPKTSHHFERLDIHSVAFTPDEQRSVSHKPQGRTDLQALRQYAAGCNFENVNGRFDTQQISPREAHPW